MLVQFERSSGQNLIVHYKIMGVQSQKKFFQNFLNLRIFFEKLVNLIEISKPLRRKIICPLLTTIKIIKIF